jgi:hypothetical protein
VEVLLVACLTSSTTHEKNVWCLQKDTPPDQKSIARYVYITMAKEIMARHQELSKEFMYSQKGIDILRGQENFGGLIKTVVDLDAEPDISVYSSAHQWDSKGQLGEFWRQGKASVDTVLRSANSELADQFANTVGQDMENLLASVKGTVSDAVLWEATAKLRDLKQRSGLVLGARAPAQWDYVRSAIDAIADCIAEHLQQIRSGGPIH